MRNTRKNRVISIIKRFAPSLALILALAPSSARAGAIQALHFTLENSLDSTATPHAPVSPPSPGAKPKPEAKTDSKDPSKAPEKPVTVGLNGNGDMAVKRGDLSVSMGYCAPEDNLEPKEQKGQVQVAQQFQKEPPSINGISLKLTFLF
ncbi:hypothetical protein [Geobacter sp. SVR]|uniref:hypothetical protein n=1 Tax=Geobacter sp. SVR TaxID=2495594 RepID=UPI00143F0208|nr:hypothetical protein [Geobacter sp. SVR]BCS55717.1 hypothetical protein GSVR_40250 [Geobacter sp. SVR]GCF83721.1 hypothetical protein GSbR_03210 [Geobacter sp. SVR]